MANYLAAILTIVLLNTPAMAEPKLEVVSNTVWAEPFHYFGGFSGLEVNADGHQITVISDQGFFVQAQLHRDPRRILGIEPGKITSVNDPAGERVAVELTDSEGLAISAAGKTFVSFEEHHRIMEVSLETGVATLLPSHPDFTRFEINAGFEALAIHPDGRLFALPETTMSETTNFPIYVFDRNRWQHLADLQRDGAFLPVGADFDDNGMLYVLERAATPLGFRSRIRRVDVATDIPADETLLTTMSGQMDNMEALSIWRDPSGQTRILLLADDNYLQIQRTQLVEFVLHE